MSTGTCILLSAIVPSIGEAGLLHNNYNAASKLTVQASTVHTHWSSANPQALSAVTLVLQARPGLAPPNLDIEGNSSQFKAWHVPGPGLKTASGAPPRTFFLLSSL